MKLLEYIRLTGVAVVCTVFSVSCATTQTTTQNRESMLVASGFKVITPKTAAQKQKLQNLPAGKVTMIQKGGKTITFSRTLRITKPTSVDPGSTGNTNS
jgi:hypothetical protein